MTGRAAALSLLLLGWGAACEPEDLLAGLPDAGPRDAAACGSSNVLFVNQSPEVFRPGERGDSVDNETPILDQEVMIGEPAMSEVDFEMLLGCVQGIFSPYDVEVTGVDPGDVDHLEVYVAASAESFGLSAGVTAVVTSDCAPGARDLGFAFALGDAQRVCEHGVAWTVGGMTGLSNSVECEDLMSGAEGDPCVGNRSFLDEEIECGHFEPEPCRCGGTTQNAHQHLLSFFGPSQCASGG